MSSRLLVNLIDPSEIVVPDTDGVPDAGVPDTGILSISKWLDEAFKNDAALFIAIGLTVLVAVVIAVLLIRRRKKHSLIKGFGGYAPMKLGAQKYLVPKLAGLSFVVLVSVFGILKFYDGQRMVNAETADGSSLTVTTEDITAIDVEMTDEATFGVGESKVKVTTATETGYTLMAYVDSTTTDLTNDSGDKIAMLETSQSQALTDNTWGISLSKPDSQDKTLFRGLPTAEKDAMVVKVSGSDATEANDETTLYYAAYITPDLGYGTYDGVTINYIAVSNVVEDDITVKFHGNGSYFDEAGTKDLNTVTYGQSCEIAYVGGKCRKVYTTEEPYTIVKTSNLNDDGTQNGPYPASWYDEDADLDVLSLNQVVSIPGADGIRVELKYGLSGDDSSYLYILNGNVGWYDAVWPYDFYEVYAGSNITGEETHDFSGDTITIFLESWDEPVEGYDYGVYAKIYPLYNTKPENLETIEATVCDFVKSENLDDEGNQNGPYPYEQYYEQYDEWDDYYNYQTVTIPGATRIKAVVEYSISPGFELEMFEGYYNGRRNGYQYIYVGTGAQAISGTEEYIFNGSTITFDVDIWEEPIGGYDYGFYARLYPYYDEELEGTTPDISCSVVRKDGEYIMPVGYDTYFAEDSWYIVIKEKGSEFLDDWNVKNEEDLIGLLREYYEHKDSIDDWEIESPFDGGVIDVYFRNYYRITYDANGGSGFVGEQWALPHVNDRKIRSNDFTRSGYSFTGWNTRADGSGTWYYPDDPIFDLAQGGETITLYAQWEITIDCNPGATSIGGAVCMQDFAGPNSDQIISSMILNAQYTLIDIRDKKTYTVAKLADGNVWMTQNLDHDIVTTTDFYTYANTDIGHGATPNTSAKWTAERATYATSNTNWYDVDDSLSNPESYDPGNLCWNGTIRNDYDGTIATDTVACGNDKHYHIGNYYNWTAAVAMNDSSSYTTGQQDVDQSICPAGWRLPTYSGNKSYDNLVTTLSLTSGTSGNVQSAPAYFVYGGAWDGWSNGVGGWGLYWSSVVNGDFVVYEFYFIRNGLMTPQELGFRGQGISVRCVAR